MNIQADLGKAIALAAMAHNGQVDRAGAPYIFHSLRVMLALQDPVDQIVGVLHDVIEDCPGVSAQALLDAGFSQQIVDALDSVTKREGEGYEAFVLRAAANPIGRRVKIQDLLDNMNIARIPNPQQSDYARVAKYKAALAVLLNQ